MYLWYEQYEGATVAQCYILEIKESMFGVRVCMCSLSSVLNVETLAGFLLAASWASQAYCVVLYCTDEAHDRRNVALKY